MTPRLSVTSSTFSRPVILRTVFSRSLPLRYSATTRVDVNGLHSWKPPSAPSVWPSPRSTRKLNCPYGRSRITAISASRCRVVREPDEVVERQLELLHGDVVALRIEVGPCPAAGPRTDEAPRVDGLAARGRELPDRHVTPVVLAGDDRPAPLEQLRRGRQGPPQHDRGEPMDRPPGGILDVGRRAQRTDRGEADLARADPDLEGAGAQQGILPAGWHGATLRRGRLADVTGQRYLTGLGQKPAQN